MVSFQYGTSVSLTADTATPLFGHSVTVTATVAPANPAAGTPSGTVTFSDGTTPLATVPLTAGQARFSTGKLQPAAHPITARYSGDPAFLGSVTARPTDVTVGFSRPCITTTHHGPLTVAADQSLCLAAGGRQDGPVIVRAGGALAVSGARINGPVFSVGARALTICQSTLSGLVVVEGTTGYVLIGSDRGAGTACAGNSIRGPLILDANTGGLEASANTTTGAVRITDNKGSGLLSEDVVPEFEANQVSGPLRCSGNEPTLSQAGNTVHGPRSGQCR